MSTSTATHDKNALKREVKQLRAQIQRMTDARKIKFKPARIAKRSGKDDIVRVIMPDSHGSYADPVAMGIFLRDLKRIDPDEIIMLGDHVDCGGFLAQHHVLGYVAQMGYSYESDIEACNQQLDMMQANAPRALIEYLEGNHEDRVERWCVQQALTSNKDSDYLRKVMAPQFLLRLKDRGINYYRRSVNYDGIQTPGTIRRGRCLYIHDPGFYDPKRTLARFAAPVVHGHDHQSHALVQPTVASGEIGVWSFGCLSIKQMLWHHTRPSNHTNGYGIQLVARSGQFLTITIPIIRGVSYLDKLFKGKG